MNSLAVGQFADAIAAFHRAREIDPKHPHVAGRLAEVERRQHAVSVAPLGNATVLTRRPRPSAPAAGLRP